MPTDLEKLHARLARKIIKEWRKEKNDGDLGVISLIDRINGVLLPVGCGLVAVAFIYFLTGPLEEKKFLFLSGGIFLGSLFLFALIVWLRRYFWRLFDRKFPIPLEIIAPVALIPAYLERRLGTIEKETIGEGSQFAEAVGRVERIRQRAETNLERIRSRLTKRPGAEHLAALISANERVVEHANSVLRELGEFRGRVAAYLAECRSAIVEIQEPLGDLELVRETNRLAREMVVAESEGWEAAAAAASRLEGMAENLRREVATRFGQARVQAVGEVDLGDAHRYLEVVERSLADFRVEKARAASSLATTLR